MEGRRNIKQDLEASGLTIDMIHDRILWLN